MTENYLPSAPVRDSNPPPIQLREIDLNVTNLCNLDCIYCSYGSTHNKNEPELAAERIHRLLDEAAEMGTRVVHFGGGEPAIRDDMHELVAHAFSLGLKMRLLSNGVLLSTKKLEELWKAGLRQVLISLDGFEAEHNRQRASSTAYSKTIQGIRNSIALGYNVRINSVATQLNVDKIPMLVPMLAEMGVATFSVFYMLPVGRGRLNQDLMVSPARWQRFIQEMQKMANVRKPDHMEVTVEKAFSWKEEWRETRPASGRGGTCLGFLDGCDYVNVLADGRVYPCACYLDVAPALGNIHQRTLKDLLNDGDSWAFYRSLQQVSPTCTRCDLLSRCRGGSRAVTKIMKGDWLALDPRCDGDPHAQGFCPICYMERENIITGQQSGFAERIQDEE